MYSEKFLRSLGLEDWIIQQEPPTSPQISATQDKSAPSVPDIEPSAQMKLELPTQAKNKPPRDCFNCEHSGQTDWCSLKEAMIEDLDAETDCPDFRKKLCGEDCGFYENGLCYFRDTEIPKNPDDECGFDVRQFM
jgi:hypothetical protein